ncbi:unnamed protein product [Mytilus coruscus]|uniref:Uncharacterized protein n=1 Tax=Mytilus coruscus TaxID=42192 RepID=A0A6J8EA87_MYTCO|nr:unnamed protein product [Mytilus coruscus]
MKNQVINSLLFSLLIQLLEAAPVFKNSSCSNPNDTILQSRFNELNNGLDMRKLFLDSDWTENDIDVRFKALISMSNSRGSSPSLCKVTGKGNDPLMFRSLCPWKIVKSNQREGIFPKSLYYAKSSCPSCIGSHKSCEPLNYRIKILERTTQCNSDGLYVYKEKTKELQIAHVCAQAREGEQTGQLVTIASNIDVPVINSLLFSLLIQLLEAAPVFKNSSCSNPNDTILQSRFNELNNGLDIRKLFLDSDWTENDIDVRFKALVSMSNSRGSSPSLCKVTGKGNDPLMFRSLCPWKIVKSNQREGIFPKSLYYAKSSCPSCIGSHKSCEPLNYRIKILERTTQCNSDGLYVYKEKTKELQIAHVCAQAREGEQTGQLVTIASNIDVPVPVR